MGITYEEIALQQKLKNQEEQIAIIQNAESNYSVDKDIDSLILFWEGIWKSDGLLFNGSKWTFRLPDLYIKVKRYDDAVKILKKIKNPVYRDKRQSYLNKIELLKTKNKER